MKLEIHPKATNDLTVCEIMTGATKLGSFSDAILNISLKNGKGVKSAMTLIGIYCEMVSPSTSTKMNLNRKIRMKKMMESADRFTITANKNANAK